MELHLNSSILNMENFRPLQGLTFVKTNSRPIRHEWAHSKNILYIHAEMPLLTGETEGKD